MSVNHLDMESLSKTNPDIFFEFSNNGNFVVSRTRNPFSSMGLDQRHEQLNKDIKGDGGMIGLTEDEDTGSVIRHCTSRILKDSRQNFDANLANLPRFA